MSFNDTMGREDEFTQDVSLPRKRPGSGCGCVTAVLAVIGLVVVLAILLCAGIGLGVGFFGMRALPPYRMALQKVQNAPQVREKLGEPVESASWIPMGNFTIENNSGSANLTFKVRGPKGPAEVNVIGRMIAGKWGLTTLTVTYPDGTRQELDVSDTGDEEMDAPKWRPGAEGKAAPPANDGESAAPSAIQPKDDDAEPGPELQMEVPAIPGNES
ncbi:MAG: cytochrome c oxidase assembly factor Coa1 family protein [Thermogutta sp.]